MLNGKTTDAIVMKFSRHYPVIAYKLLYGFEESSSQHKIDNTVNNH